MSKPAAKIGWVKKSAIPSDLPAGVERVEVSRKIKSERPSDAKKGWIPTADTRVLALHVCTPDAGGVLAITKFLSEVYEIDGPRFVSEAVRNAIATAVATRTTLGREEDSDRLIPLISPLRVVDKSELGAARMGAWLKANPGKNPATSMTQAELTAMFTGVV